MADGPSRSTDLLLDIEGTTTSISFVYDVLFPYARAQLDRYVRESWKDPALQEDVADLRVARRQDLEAGLQPPDWADDGEVGPGSAVAYLKWLMDQDRKSTPLKSIQGKILKSGYQKGELKAHVFPDVAPAFRRWKQKGRRISIFSSGSVLAQKLLFGHTEEGDLKPFLSAYFDTRTGPKMEAASYGEIVRQIERRAQSVLFVSDFVAELDAARQAGLKTRLCLRPGNKPQPPSDHAIIRDFDEIP